MANHETLPDASVPVPYKIVEEANRHLIEEPSQNQEHDALIAALPLHKPFLNLPLRLYQGFWLPEFILHAALTMRQHFKCRPTDLFLVSYPKAGTTWLKALVFATVTRNKYPLDRHPLLTHNPHQCVAFADLEFWVGRSKIVEAIPSLRVLNTHLPYSILPDSITDSNCKIIYVWRDPKDVLVSYWHFMKKTSDETDKETTFDRVFEDFFQGLHPYGPMWNHVLEYWKESKVRPEKVLFLKYEYIMQEPVRYAKKLADFIGCPYSEAEENHGIVEQIIELCSFQKLKHLEVNKTGKIEVSNMQFSHASFFRKGEVGDWRNHMTEEMAKRLDSIIEEKFKGFGLEI